MTTQATLTLRDFADLAKVARPVVSMWRKRLRVVPFPAPVRKVGGIEHFDRDEVVDYLRRTGRGNNPDFHLDAPAGTVPDGADLDELIILLCLRTALDDELATASEKVQMAAAYTADPDDRFLVQEVLDLEPSAAALGYVDDLFEASRGPGEALDRLERGRLARQRAANGLSGDCLELVATVAEGCIGELGVGDGRLGYGGGDPELAAGVMGRFARVSLGDGGPEIRGLRRRAYLREIEHEERPGSVITIASVVGKSDAESLRVLDELILNLAAGQAIAVIGPSSALVERLSGEAEQRRSGMLRSRSLACALRLPRGFWLGAHRQALAIWVCVGAADVARPMAADLESVAAGEKLVLDDLRSDVAAAVNLALAGKLGDRQLNPLHATSIRAFRYLRLHRLDQIQSTGRVVPRGMRAERLVTSGYRDRVIELTLLTSVAGPTFDVPVADAASAIVVIPHSLGDLDNRNELTVKRGSRIDLTAGDADGTIEVWTGDGPTGTRYDPLEAERRNPNARRTEAGDVVFQSKPRPRATVDTRGGALVASPARILRLRDAIHLGPHTLAAVINLQPDGSGEWESWLVPRLTPEQNNALETALREAAEYEEQMRMRVDAVRRLQHELIAGVAAGAIAVGPETEEMMIMKEIG